MEFKWTKIEQDSFDKIKQIMDRDTLLNYPGFNEKIKIQANDRKFQLGAFIREKGKPIDLYSLNLIYALKRYTETENELLSIVETLKRFELYYLVRDLEYVLIIKTLRVIILILI